MPRMAMKDCPLFFFDCETGGLEPTKADMLEVACIVTDPSGRDVREEFCAKVLPMKPVHPEAAKVNGYTREKWASAGAGPLDPALTKMLLMARNSIFVAHNTPFDWAFFKMAMDLRLQKWPGDYHKIDTCALAVPLLRAGKVPNVKLVTLTQYYGIEHGAAHTALADAKACRQLYLKLMEVYDAAFAATTVAA